MNHWSWTSTCPQGQQGQWTAIWYQGGAWTQTSTLPWWSVQSNIFLTGSPIHFALGSWTDHRHWHGPDCIRTTDYQKHEASIPILKVKWYLQTKVILLEGCLKINVGVMEFLKLKETKAIYIQQKPSTNKMSKKYCTRTNKIKNITMKEILK